jgi:hypothetical protein
LSVFYVSFHSTPGRFEVLFIAHDRPPLSLWRVFRGQG